MSTENAVPAIAAVAALVCVVVLGAASDLRSRRIPNALTIGALLIALGLRAIIGLESFIAGVLGAGLAFAVAIPLFAMRGIGGGDAKMLIAVGGFFGPLGCITALLATAVAGGALSIVAALRSGVILPIIFNTGGLLLWVFTLGRSGERVTLTSPGSITVPYGLAIAVGTGIALLIRGGI